MAGSNITIRQARRSDIPALARIANDANAKSAIHKRMAPNQDRYPLDYYYWRLNIMRERFVTPDLRIMVAEDSSSGVVLGIACWAVEGSDTALYKKWVGEHGWSDWLEGKLVEVEKKWNRYVNDRSIDYAFLKKFLDGFLGAERAPRPPCLHCHLIVVDPHTQSRGVGRMLIDWAKDLAVKEKLPIFLESNLEATGFYEKSNFSRMTKDVVISLEGQEPIHIPAYAWEGKQNEGHWLSRDGSFDGTGERWKWRDEVLTK